MEKRHHRTAAPDRLALDVGIVVADLERSLGFYRDIVGLTVVVAEVATSLLGTGRMVQLAHGNSRLKLVELEETPTQRNPPGAIAAAVGLRYFTVLLPDLEAVMARVEASRAAVLVSVTRLANGTAIAMVADPDGNVVEFVREA